MRPGPGWRSKFPVTASDPCRFAPEVPDELASAVLWYEARRQRLGRELLDEVQATLALVDERPRSLPRLQVVDATLEIRRALLARFPYALVFLGREDEVRVPAVAHAKRRPGYWFSRV